MKPNALALRVPKPLPLCSPRRQPRRLRPGARRSRAAGGFTLVELMVVLAILAILSAVAYPSYRDHALRGQLVDASNGLATVRAQMERHFQDNRSYATTGSFTTPCAADAAGRTFGLFVVSCATTPTASGFSLKAVGSGSAAGFTYTINQQDLRATTTVPSGWSTCTSAWIMKKGQTC